VVNRLGLKWSVVPVLAIAVLVTACGSSSSSSSGGSTGSSGGGGPQAAGGGGDFCKVVREQLAELKTVMPKDFSNADQLKTYGTFIEDSNAKIVAAAPAEIRADVETQARISTAAAASYKSGGRPSSAVAAQLRSPEYQAAAKKVALYAKDKCGISPQVAASP
jgi:hypothetical protein